MSVDGDRNCETEERLARVEVAHQQHGAGSQPAIRAVLLDLDGTLYLQRPMRLQMLHRLLSYCAFHPVAGYRVIRIANAYRRAQEALRQSAIEPPAFRDLAEAQILMASNMVRVDPEVARSCVGRWIEREPLDLLKRYLRPGVQEFLVAASERGLRLAVVSDYPAADKLRSMGLAEFFEVVVSASDTDVQRFKPHPKGIQIALARLGVAPEEAVYIGDREGVDSAAAERAGVRFVILKPREKISTSLFST